MTGRLLPLHKISNQHSVIEQSAIKMSHQKDTSFALTQGPELTRNQRIGIASGGAGLLILLFSWAFQKAVKEAGLSGVWIPKDYGGAGGSVLDLCLVVEQFARACGGMGVAYAVNALGSFPILLGGTEEQKRRWLPSIASGDKLISFGLSEKDAGS